MECFCWKPRCIQCKIVLLDEQELIHEIQDNSTGQVILDVVFRHLNLLETAYFGLRFLDQDGQTHWLDPAKKLSRQLKGADPYTLYFGVKFYAADPCKLLEEITRYQFFLQVKQDVLQGRLPVTFELAAELGAYIVQSELGDYDPRRHSPGYVSEFRFLSNQTLELETRIAELHKTLVGQLPSVAELNYLDKVKWLEMYGVDLHPVLGEDNVEYFLGLTPSGIIVLRNKNTVGNYYWPRISKIYFKGRYFMLRITDKNNDESTYGFETPSKAACKHLWKCCVEHHAFFRLVQVSPTTPDIFALGSRFRYRTEKQAVRDAQMKVRTPPSFSRTPSRRYQRRVVEGSNDAPPTDDPVKIDHYQPSEVKHISVPQPAQSFESPYRSTCNTSTVDVRQRSDSPRSTRSAPWSQPHSRGLYNSSVPPSPRSVRSAGPRYRSSSVDSQSSNDSRSCKSKRKHRSRMTSDNESELSKSSSRSHRKHRRHRSRGNRKDSGSEQENTTQRRKSMNKSRHSDSHYELVDSGSQWREVQRKQAGEGAASTIQQANVISSRRSGYSNSGLETESEMSYRNRHRRQRKHRSRSRSPDTKTWLPDELKKHLEFDLIDTFGMSESQLREIPYTVVQTNHAKQMKIKHLQWAKGDGSSQSEKRTDSPPPPYSPQISEANRARSIRVSHSSLKSQSSSQQLSGNADFISMTTSSIASNSSTHSASNNLLPRMLDSLAIADNYSYNSGSQRSGKSSRVGSSALYGNPNTLLGGLSNGFQDSDSPRVSHEHTDSGLGGEQDCTYGSERSSDSAKHGHGTNKGSGGEARIGLIPVSKTFTSDYQPLNPQQLYPSHSSMAGSRVKQALNVGKSSVYKQELDSRYGQFKTSSRISCNTYNASNTQTHHLESASHKHPADARSSFMRTGAKLSNASYNSHLIDHNTSLRGSVRSVASSPVSNGNNESGPLRLQYRTASSMRSKRTPISNRSEIDDNYIYTDHTTDTNKNINDFFSRCQSRSIRNANLRTKPPLPPINRRSRSISLEYILTPLIRSSQQSRQQ